MLKLLSILLLFPGTLFGRQLERPPLQDLLEESEQLPTDNFGQTKTLAVRAPTLTESIEKIKNDTHYNAATTVITSLERFDCGRYDEQIKSEEGTQLMVPASLVDIGTLWPKSDLFETDSILSQYLRDRKTPFIINDTNHDISPRPPEPEPELPSRFTEIFHPEIAFAPIREGGNYDRNDQLEQFHASIEQIRRSFEEVTQQFNDDEEMKKRDPQAYQVCKAKIALTKNFQIFKRQTEEAIRIDYDRQKLLYQRRELCQKLAKHNPQITTKSDPTNPFTRPHDPRLIIYRNPTDILSWPSNPPEENPLDLKGESIKKLLESVGVEVTDDPLRERSEAEILRDLTGHNNKPTSLSRRRSSGSVATYCKEGSSLQQQLEQLHDPTVEGIKDIFLKIVPKITKALGTLWTGLSELVDSKELNGGIKNEDMARTAAESDYYKRERDKKTEVTRIQSETISNLHNKVRDLSTRLEQTNRELDEQEDKNKELEYQNQDLTRENQIKDEEIKRLKQKESKS